jgi:predicted  nucleic acid-binding Zn-ribbon protein
MNLDFHGAKSRFGEKMTKSEYQELAEFLGDQFQKVNQRFDAMEMRLTRVEVLGEQDRDRMRILAEGIAHVTESLEAFRQEVSTQFAAVRSEMHVGFAAVRGEMAEGFAEVRSEMDQGFEAQTVLIEGLGGRASRRSRWTNPSSKPKRP